jgi:hypothetical protein
MWIAISVEFGPNEIGRREEIEELLLGHPSPADDDLLAHPSQVRCRSAEHRRAELQEQNGDLAQRSFLSGPLGRSLHGPPRRATDSMA